MNPEYLGDGVYVMIERGMIKLCTGSHDNPDQTIYLESEVYAALVEYVARMKAPENAGNLGWESVNRYRTGDST